MCMYIFMCVCVFLYTIFYVLDSCAAYIFVETMIIFFPKFFYEKKVQKIINPFWITVLI